MYVGDDYQYSYYTGYINVWHRYEWEYRCYGGYGD